MTNLTDHDVERIADALAPRLIQQVHDRGHQFWIDPEQHYRDHLNMREMHGAFSSARAALFYAFVGLVALGVIVLGAFGLGGKVAQLFGTIK